MTGMDRNSPKLLAQSVDICGSDNFPTGCKVSPDGLCVLTSTNSDSKLRLYNTVLTGENAEVDDTSCESTAPVPWKAALSADGGNAIRCYDWYPFMKSDESASCCFIATARNQPIHLYDAYSGLIRATYRAYNSLDELESAMVVAFDPSGQSIVAAGFRTADQRTIHLFDTAVPGRQSTTMLLGKTRRSKDGQKGLVSSLAYGAVSSNLLAVGTYSPGSIYIYDPRTGARPSGTVLRDGHCIAGKQSQTRNSMRNKRKRFDTCDDGLLDSIEGSVCEETLGDITTSATSWVSSAKTKWYEARTRGGVTQLLFGRGSHEHVLYSASRRSNAILAWDLRMLSDQHDHVSRSCTCYGLASFETANDTNQRLQFDLNDTGDTLFVAGSDKCVRIYDIKTGHLKQVVKGLEDAVNGVSYCRLPAANGPTTEHMAVTTGSRHFPLESEFDDERIDLLSSGVAPGCIRLYKL